LKYDVFLSKVNFAKFIYYSLLKKIFLDWTI
jgi:hypothetical protein